MLKDRVKNQRAAAPPPLDPRAYALFLDLDGTLLELAEHPDDVTPAHELRTLLPRLPDVFSGAVALLTGRTIANADRVLAHAFPNIAGIHGLELRVRGRVQAAAQQNTDIADAANEIESAGLPARIEDKGASIALHYRHAPDAGGAIVAKAEAIAAQRNLRALHGKMVVELLAGAHTKGDAIGAFMAEAAFAGRIPIAVGDDITDEDAFAAAHAAGGYGVLVGAPRDTAARYRLDKPAAVLTWLGQAVRS